ncbi:hypothetical protein ACIHCM_34575 [Streptomyces sp. NPDC052023]|uniref:hypothetical protein n=1 Tax=Streptomyces sp. NPDC052023 TaxID=3365681 RepID=UPI0037D795D4
MCQLVEEAAESGRFEAVGELVEFGHAQQGVAVTVEALNGFVYFVGGGGLPAVPAHAQGYRRQAVLQIGEGGQGAGESGDRPGVRVGGHGQRLPAGVLVGRLQEGGVQRGAFTQAVLGQATRLFDQFPAVPPADVPVVLLAPGAARGGGDEIVQSGGEDGCFEAGQCRGDVLEQGEQGLPSLEGVGRAQACGVHQEGQGAAGVAQCGAGELVEAGHHGAQFVLGAGLGVGPGGFAAADGQSFLGDEGPQVLFGLAVVLAMEVA